MVDGGQGQNRTADTGIFSLSLIPQTYTNQALITLISYSPFSFTINSLRQLRAIYRN